MVLALTSTVHFSEELFLTQNQPYYLEFKGIVIGLGSFTTRKHSRWIGFYTKPCMPSRHLKIQPCLGHSQLYAIPQVGHMLCVPFAMLVPTKDPKPSLLCAI